MFRLPSVRLSGADMLPIVEGGKGISVSTGLTAGLLARCGGVGTVSAVNADFYDESGNIVRCVYKAKTREERHAELIRNAIKGGIAQIEKAHDISCGNGRIHMNMLWGMAGVEAMLCGILDKVRGLVHGVTCGAGMPYKLAEIAAKYKTYYYPIVSSARAFKILYRRSYSKFVEWLGGVVYEDPWLAGGHVGLSNAEDPNRPEFPYTRVKELRQAMTELGMASVPIIVAGGVWWLSEWQDWIDNPEVGPIAFQFGSRMLLTQESPIPDEWKKLLLTLKKDDIILNKFSPTGFYSSAILNGFVKELIDRASRQVKYTIESDGDHTYECDGVFITESDKKLADEWVSGGYSAVRKTPDSTLLFLKPNTAKRILKDQMDCVGCLSACTFSGWNELGMNIAPDPRTFCIQKTLQDISHDGSVDGNLLFSGKMAYRFSEDPFYAGGFIPTVKQLFDRILTGF